jgi:hypothetical protein
VLGLVALEVVETPPIMATVQQGQSTQAAVEAVQQRRDLEILAVQAAQVLSFFLFLLQVTQVQPPAHQPSQLAAQIRF